MSLALFGIGTAAPARRILQRDAAELAAAFTLGEPGHDRTVAARANRVAWMKDGALVAGEAP